MHLPSEETGEVQLVDQWLHVDRVGEALAEQLGPIRYLPASTATTARPEHRLMFEGVTIRYLDLSAFYDDDEPAVLAVRERLVGPVDGVLGIDDSLSDADAAACMAWAEQRMHELHRVPLASRPTLGWYQPSADRWHLRAPTSLRTALQT